MLNPKRLPPILETLLNRRAETLDRKRRHLTDLRRQASEASARMARLYQAIDEGIADLADPELKARIAELTAVRDRAQHKAERVETLFGHSPVALTQDHVKSSPSPLGVN